jgi:hypothetical protein
MTASSVRQKVDALLLLAGGSSNRAAADAAGVAPGTISAWRKNPVFAAELATVKAVVERRPIDADAVMAALVEAAARLAPPGPQVAADGSFRVTVTIPADASPRTRQQIMARALARGIAAAARGQS